MKTWTCVICGKEVPDYKPIYCCDGSQCGCMGLPIEPCLCSKECAEWLYRSTTDEEDTIKPT